MPQSVQELIQALLRAWGLDQYSREQEIFSRWEEAAGEPLARQARPVAIHEGRLIIAVRDSAWLQELQFMKDDLKRRLNRVLGRGVIRDIRFKLGSWEDPTRSDEDSRTLAGERKPDLPADVIAEAEAAVSVIRDPVLRAQVLRFLLASARWKRAEEDGENESE